MFRGLKPTATITRSLRDEGSMPVRGAKDNAVNNRGRGATIDGSRAFQRRDTSPVEVLRRVATLDVSESPVKSRN
jgi:hypothetical protein